jgi:hypothetical protein
MIMLISVCHRKRKEKKCSQQTKRKIGFEMQTNTTNNMKGLYRLGGIAPLVTLTFYMGEFIFIRWDKFPTSTEQWFMLFQRSKLLGLFYLNSLDILSITLLGIMFLALFMALRKTNQAAMIVATLFGLLGVAVFVVPRVAMLSIMTLSDRYALAATEAERVRLLAAGEMLEALGTPTPQTVGFFFMAIGVLILSIVMLNETKFNKITAWIGILASLFTFADDLSLVAVPALATPLMIASGLFWIPWWVMIGVGLLRLPNQTEIE